MPIDTDINGRMMILGSGTSHGVPVIGCDCPTCTSSDPRDSRTRCSAILGLPEGKLLIDTPPEMRMQLLRERIGIVDSVFITHAHADHLFGFDDLRIFPHYTETNLPVFCTEKVEEKIRSTFAYIFNPVVQNFPAGGIPKIDFHRIDHRPIRILGADVIPIRMHHGRSISSGIRIGDVAYCTDFKNIDPEELDKLHGLKTLVLGCIRFEPHITHLCIDEACELVERIRPEQTWLTHISHYLKHEEVSAMLPDGIAMTHDGQTIPLE